MSLYTLVPLIKANVLHRPSKTIKRPYVADIMLEDGSTALCHTPGLGCSGMVATNRTIYVSKSGPKCKTAYTAQLSESVDAEGTYYIGIHPMVSQHIASKLLDKISTTVEWKSEVKINEHTRLDFVGTASTGKKIYVEVKNAMISHSTDVRATRRAIFPEGYRKSKTEPISPRAVKHAETLTELVKLADTEAAYLVFIVPRNDCGGGLEINPLDTFYCKAVSEALKAGVVVKVFGLNFTKEGTVTFEKELPFILV
jgi:DNA-binding sugar fermentation-stimulating protein